MDMEGVEQMETMEAKDDIQDNPLLLVKGQKKYDLKDRPETAKFDSLWMKELYDSTSLFDSIYQDITTLEMDSVYHFNVDTDTLKARLKDLKSKNTL